MPWLALAILVVVPFTASAQSTVSAGGPTQPAVSVPSVHSANAGTTRRAAIISSLRLLVIEHGFRIAFQEKTRRALAGPFFADYVHSLRVPRTWEDGDPWLVNYVGHPIHGAAAGRTWLMHHPDHDAEIGLSKRYWTSRAHAAEWATFYSLQFEFGPLSEAALGNIGLSPRTTGWVDHVVTPIGAFGMIVAEDALDRYLVQLIERKVRNPVARAVVRTALNPSRSLANVTAGRTPWFRTRGPLRADFQP